MTSRLKRCYLIRHGQTAWNHENRLQGHSDQPLNTLGEQQAACVGTFFSTHQLRGVYSSMLLRSQQTAQAIVGTNGHARPFVVDQALAEIHLGVWEGLTPEQIDAQFNGAYQQWKTCPSSVGIPEAEPLDRFRERVRHALQRIVDTTEDGAYAIVTHGGVIASVLADSLGADYDLILRRLRLDNAGVTTIEFSTSVPTVLGINWTAHLASLHETLAVGSWPDGH